MTSESTSPEIPNEATAEEASSSNGPRSRRAILAAAAGGVVATVVTALDRPQAANAAAGDPLILGQINTAGTSPTRLNTNSSGGAFWMTQTGSGSGVRGDSTSGHGSVFTTEAADRFGVYAQQNAAGTGTGAAVRALGGQNQGINATTGSANLAAIFGENTSVAADGGGSDHTGRGVVGYASGDGDFIFLFFLLFPVPSAGVAGFNFYDGGSAEAAAGVWGESADDGSQALRGINWGGGEGIWAASVNGIAGYFSATNDLALYCSGDGQVTGDLTVDGTIVNAAATSFRIDHPTAPSSKLLTHAAIGSPDMLNVYTGNVVTDAKGKATVQLPAWFSAVNKDLRYQLTTIGKQAQAWVASEVADGAFSLATDKPDTKVSWQIAGVRADAWANAHRLDAVTTKTGRASGRYVHPELHGKSADKAISYRRPDPIMEATKKHGAARVKKERLDFHKRTQM